MLGPAVDLKRNARFAQGLFQDINRFIDNFFTYLPFLLHLVDKVIVLVRFHITERQVFQFPFNIENTQAMRQGRINFQRFLGNTLLFFAAHKLERAHIMQPVRQLDNNDTHILGHGQEHFTHTVDLLVFLRPVIKPVQLGNAVDEKGHFFTEEPLHIFKSIRRIFNDIVHQRRRYSRCVDFHVRQDLGHCQRV